MTERSGKSLDRMATAGSQTGKAVLDNTIGPRDTYRRFLDCARRSAQILPSSESGHASASNQELRPNTKANANHEEYTAEERLCVWARWQCGMSGHVRLGPPLDLLCGMCI